MREKGLIYFANTKRSNACTHTHTNTHTLIQAQTQFYLFCNLLKYEAVNSGVPSGQLFCPIKFSKT